MICDTSKGEKDMTRRRGKLQEKRVLHCLASGGWILLFWTFILCPRCAEACMAEIEIKNGRVKLVENSKTRISSVKVAVAIEHYEVAGGIYPRYADVECKATLKKTGSASEDLLLGLYEERESRPYTDYDRSRYSDVEVHLDEEKRPVHHMRELVRQHVESRRGQVYQYETYVPWHYVGAYMPFGAEAVLRVRYRHRLSFANSAGVYKFLFPFEIMNGYGQRSGTVKAEVAYPGPEEMQERLKEAGPAGYLQDKGRLMWEFNETEPIQNIVVTERVLLKH